MTDEPSLRAKVVRRWKAELFSADTVVAAVSVAVAVPTAFLTVFAVDAPALLFPLLTVAGTGPTLAHENGRHEGQSMRAAATWGFVATVLFAVAFLAVLFAGYTLGLENSEAPVVALVVTLVGGTLVGRSR